MSNIVIIGFKAAGKTTLATQLAKKMGKRFIDTDQMILNVFRKGKTAFEIYQELGEKKFRAVENEVIASLSNTDDSIIATGGGSLLRKDNREVLKKLGVVVYIATPLRVIKKRLQMMKSTFTSHENIEKEWHERSNDYLEAASIVFDPEESINTLIERIMSYGK